MRLTPYVKICCISSVEEARLAVSHGVSALGLVSAMPSGPGVIAEATIADIARQVPPPVATFLLTAYQTAPEIIAQHRRCATSTIQLVDAVAPAELAELRSALPGIKLVQVIHVTGEHSIEEARAVETLVDAILLDSGNPALAIKELGGTGRTHDWAISRALREAVSVPVFLAGGLNEHNVAEAVDAVEPFGVDLCSSVRSNGKLDSSKLRRFMAALDQRRAKT